MKVIASRRHFQLPPVTDGPTTVNMIHQYIIDPRWWVETVPGYVSKVYDTIGNAHLTQDTPANQPEAVLSFANRNNKPGIRVETSPQWMTSPIIPAVAQPVTIWLVFRENFASNLDATTYYTQNADSSNMRLGGVANANNRMRFHAGVNTTWDGTRDTSWHYWQINADGANTRVYKDGSSVSTQNAGALPFVGRSIFAAPDGSFPCAALSLCAFMGVYSVNCTTSGQKTEIEDWIKTYYNF